MLGGVIAAAAARATNEIAASHAARRRICHSPRKINTAPTDRMSGCVSFGVAAISHMLSSFAESAPVPQAHAIRIAVPINVVRAGVNCTLIDTPARVALSLRNNFVGRKLAIQTGLPRIHARSNSEITYDQPRKPSGLKAERRCA